MNTYETATAKPPRWVIRSYITAAVSFSMVCLAVISRGW